MLSLDVMGRIPTVISADGTSFQMAMQQLEKPWRWTFGGNHILERLVFHRAAAVVTFSRWAARSIVADHGLDPKRVHVIPPGIDLADFPVLAMRERGGHAAAPRRVLFVGGEFERKGGPLLVEAFLARFGSDESVELHLVTNAATIASHPRIFIHEGIVAYSPAWHELYRAADLFVMPTKRDQSPIVFLEAMAAGLPVITTPVGSATEVVIDGETGYIVAQNDALALQDRMARLLDDPGLRARFGAAGRAHLEASFEAEANARVLERLLHEVARPRR
jgi:glycosyltransferase involved in cell wall biosynthesis